MKNPLLWTRWLVVVFVAALALPGPPARAQSEARPGVPPPPALAVQGPLIPQPGVADLRFAEFYRLPVGPRGLQPSPRLLSLGGQPVRLVGYMAQLGNATHPAPPGLLILSPLPVSLSDEDESFADDLPATAVYVHLAPGSGVVPPVQGLLALTGRLEIGAVPEADGRISFIRLWLDAPTSQLLAPAFVQEKLNAPSR